LAIERATPEPCTRSREGQPDLPWVVVDVGDRHQAELVRAEEVADHHRPASRRRRRGRESALVRDAPAEREEPALEPHRPEGDEREHGAEHATERDHPEIAAEPLITMMMAPAVIPERTTRRASCTLAYRHICPYRPKK
jgi:hypothetical protein